VLKINIINQSTQSISPTNQHKILSSQLRFRVHSLITARKKLPWQSDYPLLGQLFIETIIKT